MSRSTLPAPLSARNGAPVVVRRPSAPAGDAPRREHLVAGRFEVLGLIGVGGMGSVYRARDVTLDEMVALKVIAREIAVQPGMLERFRREVKLARRVTHPNVARCFDIGQDGDDRFFTMELVEGESLGSRLLRTGRLEREAVVAIALEVCAGLGAAHRAGVVHRDLKPDNVLLASDGRVVLTDFGIASARLPNDGASRTVGIIVGTPEYMAPEQVEGVRDIDGRADIYSLGAMMFELITGSPAWTGPTSLAIVAARLAMDPPDPRTYVALDDGLAVLILRCMARRREDRFPDVEALSRALHGLFRPEPATRRSREAPSMVPSVAPNARPSASSTGARSPLREKSVMVFARADEEDELAQAVAEGLADLVERHLRGAASVRVVSGMAPQRLRASDATGPSSAADAARAVDASIVLEATVALAGRSVAVDVDLLNVVDGVVLSSTHHTAPRSDLFGVAESIAREAAGMLLAGHTPTLPSGIGDAESLDLWLRARVQSHSRATDTFARDRAVAMFERAMTRTPDDVWVLAGYAATLVERFHHAETPSSDLLEALGMAERVIRATEVLGEAWLARAGAHLELGNPCGAAADLERARHIMPSYARVHALRGRMLLEGGATERARRHLDRAASLDASLVAPRLDAALAAALGGGFAEATAAVEVLVEDRAASADAWLLGARIALWTADVPRARALRSALGRRTLERAERAGYVLEVALGNATSDGADYFAWLAEGDTGAPRRCAAARCIEAEIAAVQGDLPRAIDAVDAAVSTPGFFDVAWLDGCPALAPVRSSPRFAELRQRVLGARQDVLESLDCNREES